MDMNNVNIEEIVKQVLSGTQKYILVSLYSCNCLP